MKRRGRKKGESSVKAIGLFDHIKHIRLVQDPDYYKNLTDADRKNFSPFMILRGLSMNPELLEQMSFAFKYFDQIPHDRMYQLLINGLVPKEHPRSFHPWVKGKKSPVSNTIVELIARYFEISMAEARDHALLLLSRENGKELLEEFCRDYGLSKDETAEALKGTDDE